MNAIYPYSDPDGDYYPGYESDDLARCLDSEEAE